LSPEAFAQLKEAFPEWYTNLIKYDPIYQSLIKYAKNIKLRLADKKQGKLDQMEKSPRAQFGKKRTQTKEYEFGKMKTKTKEHEHESEKDKESESHRSKGGKEDKKTDQHLPLPLIYNENQEGLYTSLKLRNIPRSRLSSNQLASDRGNPETEITDKPQIKTFFIAIPNEDNSMLQTGQNISNSRNNNDLPDGDKEPLEDKLLGLPNLTNNQIASLVLPQANNGDDAISRGHDESLTPTMLNRDKLPQAQFNNATYNPVPLMSPAANDNTNFVSERASIFKKVHHQNHHDIEALPSKEIEVKAKKGFFAKLFGFFRGKTNEEVAQSKASSHFHKKSLGDSFASPNLSTPTLTKKLSMMKGQSMQRSSLHSQVHVASFLIQDEFDRHEDISDNNPNEDDDFQARRRKRLSLRKANTLPKKGNQKLIMILTIIF